MNLVIFRESKNRNEDRQSLKPHHVFFCPAIKTKKIVHKVPQSKFDYCLITSANTMRYLSKTPKSKTWVFIGKESLRAGKKVSGDKVILGESHAGAIEKFFRDSRKERGRIFFPRSKIADTNIVRKLRKLGYEVCVRHIYTTDIFNITKNLNMILRRSKISAYLLTSPSTVKALKKSFRRAELKKMNVKWLAIGPSTAKEIRALGISPKVAKDQSIRGLKNAL